jgi:hypothetical protein
MDLGGLGVAASNPGPPPSAGAAATSPSAHWTFHDLLHALNPLQHLPVIGMIYRAVTGDEIDPAVRIGGSFVTGFLTGGPVGAAASAFCSLLGGFVEDMFHRMVHEIGAASSEPSLAVAAAGISASVPAGVTPERMRAGLAAYDRTQGVPLAGGWHPAQECHDASQCSG